MDVFPLWAHSWVFPVSGWMDADQLDVNEFSYNKRVGPDGKYKSRHLPEAEAVF